MILSFIFAIIYLLSLISLSTFYLTESVSVSFWMIITLFIPIVNTILLIFVLFKVYGSEQIKKFFSIKKFLSDINKI